MRYQALQVQYPDSPTKAPLCRGISPYRSSSGFPFSQTRASQKYRKPFRFSHRAKQLALMWRYRTLQVQYPDWIFCSQTLQKILNRASILPRKHLSAFYPAQNKKTRFLTWFLYFVRDGRIELPLTVWKTVILPLN